MTGLWRGAVLALALLGSATALLQVDDQGLQSNRARHVTKRTALMKEWVVRVDGMEENDDQRLQQLYVALPGRVFVRHEQGAFWERWAHPGVVAHLVVSGDAPSLLEAVDVTATDAQQLRLEAKASAGSVHGHILTEITLIGDVSGVTSLEFSGSGELVVGDQVLANHEQNTVELLLGGSGNLFIEERSALTVDQLHATVSGSGTLRLAAPFLQANKVAIGVKGSGSLNLFVDAVQASETDIGIGGSGDVCVEANDYFTDKLVAGVALSGDISFSHGGRCGQQISTVLGSGDIYTGVLQCDDVTVSTFGSGDVVVHASGAIHGVKYGSGSIHYVGEAPRVIQDQNANTGKKYKPLAKHASSNKYHKCHRGNVPLAEAVRVHLHSPVGFGLFGWAPSANDRASLIPLVIVAIIAATYLWVENRNRIARRRARFFHETQPFATVNGPQHWYQPVQH